MRTNIKRGMRLYSLDGRLLGRVAGVNELGVRARSGFFVRRHFLVRWGEVARASGGSVVVLRRGHPLDLHPMDLERARIDSAKFQSQRLPYAEKTWQGKDMSPLDRIRMEELSGLGVATRERLPEPTRTFPPDTAGEGVGHRH